MPHETETTRSADRLAEALRNGAAGEPGIEAAVELLIRSGVWLHRDDFTDDLWMPYDDVPDMPPWARVDWAVVRQALDAGAFPCSPAEAGILAIAASLAADYGARLGSILTSLDSRNRALVAAAVGHAGGGHPVWPGEPAAEAGGEEVETLRRLVRDLADEDPCWFDHRGGCQAHGYLSLAPGEQCPHAEAKELLGLT